VTPLSPVVYLVRLELTIGDCDFLAANFLVDESIKLTRADSRELLRELLRVTHLKGTVKGKNYLVTRNGNFLGSGPNFLGSGPYSLPFVVSAQNSAHIGGVHAEVISN
jgi:hypothetical protein